MLNRNQKNLISRGHNRISESPDSIYLIISGSHYSIASKPNASDFTSFLSLFPLCQVAFLFACPLGPCTIYRMSSLIMANARTGIYPVLWLSRLFIVAAHPPSLIHASQSVMFISVKRRIQKLRHEQCKVETSRER